MANVETRLSSQLSKREQEMMALQARMQASYQDHVSQTQALNAKVSTHMYNSAFFVYPVINKSAENVVSPPLKLPIKG